MKSEAAGEQTGTKTISDNKLPVYHDIETFNQWPKPTMQLSKQHGMSPTAAFILLDLCDGKIDCARKVFFLFDESGEKLWMQKIYKI